MTTFHRFRVAAVALIAFNLIGTLITWAAHLSKPGTGAGHAILQGTEFTGPLAFIALWVACAFMLWANDRVATVGTWLLTVFALGFSVGETSELMKSNVGVSSAKWSTIIVLDVIGLALALTVVALGVLTIIHTRRVAATAR